MADAAQLRRLVAYNQWANEKVLKAIDGMTAEELARPVDAYFGSVGKNLQHVLGAMRVWLARWKAEVPPSLQAPIAGAWTDEPTTWDGGFFQNLFAYDWELTTSPAGAKQWKPKNPEAQGTVPDAHDPQKRHAPMMLTTDLALKVDPIYAPIAKRFHENPAQLADAFARAWF